MIAVREARAFVPPPELQTAGQFLAAIERQKEIDAFAVLTAWANDRTLPEGVRIYVRQALKQLKTRARC